MSFSFNLRRRKKRDADSAPLYNDEFDDLSQGMFRQTEDDEEVEMQYRDKQERLEGQDDRTSVGSRASFSSIDEKATFELHLTQLQDQLVSVMIENQNLSTELKALQSNETVQRLKKDLEKEKERNRTLEKEHITRRGKRPSSKDDRQDQMRSSPAASLDNLDSKPSEAKTPPPKTFYECVRDRTIGRLYDIMDDWAELTLPEKKKPDVVKPLSVKVLKGNIKRFTTAAKPYKGIIQGLHNLIVWKSPSYTFIVFLLYLYVVYCGWLLPSFFFLAALRMAVSYLQFKNVNIHLSYLDAAEETQETEDVLKLSDKVNLVLEVATKVQNALGTCADGLEKIMNLFSWHHYKGAQRVFLMLCSGFIVTAVVPTSYLWRAVGMALGVKLFIVNCVYSKYPRMKQRYDSSHRLWQELPTNQQFHQQCAQDELEKYVIVPREGEEPELGTEAVEADGRAYQGTDDGTDEYSDFRSRFSLPPSETPLPGWGGKRAILFGKDKSLFNILAHKRGKFFLTKNFLCFEREKTLSKRNLLIPLQDIVSVGRVKIYQMNPGRGMAIQIVVNTNGIENTLKFGGLIGRDEAVSSIQRAMESVRQGRPSSQASPGSERARPPSSNINTFTLAAHYEDSDSD